MLVGDRLVFRLRLPRVLAGEEHGRNSDRNGQGPGNAPHPCTAGSQLAMINMQTPTC